MIVVIKKKQYYDSEEKVLYMLQYDVDNNYDTVKTIQIVESYRPLGTEYANREDQVLKVVMKSPSEINITAYTHSEDWNGTRVKDQVHLTLELEPEIGDEDPFFTYPDKLDEWDIKKLLEDIKKYIMDIIDDLL